MRWLFVTLLVAGQAEGGACPDFENITRPMWSIHKGKVEIVKRSEEKVMAKVRWVVFVIGLIVVVFVVIVFVVIVFVVIVFVVIIVIVLFCFY